MGPSFLRCVGLVCVALVAVACKPSGGPSSGGGPPFVWVCTPANYDFGNNGQADLNIFNAGAATANVTAHFLAKDGSNLAGQPIPATNPVVNYPGQVGNATVPIANLNTRITSYMTGGGLRQNSNALLASIHVISDQPIVVGMTLFSGPPQSIPCSAVTK